MSAVVTMVLLSWLWHFRGRKFSQYLVEFSLSDWSADTFTETFEFTEAQFTPQKHIEFAENVSDSTFKEHTHLLGSICGCYGYFFQLFSV